jgi:hypothetical protein
LIIVQTNYGNVRLAALTVFMNVINKREIAESENGFVLLI